jgi:hypothetical protein
MSNKEALSKYTIWLVIVSSLDKETISRRERTKKEKKTRNKDKDEKRTERKRKGSVPNLECMVCYFYTKTVQRVGDDRWGGQCVVG